MARYDSTPLDVTVGTEVTWTTGRYARRVFATVDHVTPTGRFKVRGFTCNPDGTVRGNRSSNPWSVRIATPDDHANEDRKKANAALAKDVRAMLDDAEKDVRRAIEWPAEDRPELLDLRAALDAYVAARDARDAARRAAYGRS